MKDEIKEINITFPGQILDYVDTKEHLLELFNYITNLQERKITKEDVDKYFKENKCISFNKFIENWNDQEELTNYYMKQNKRLQDRNIELVLERDRLKEYIIERIEEYNNLSDRETSITYKQYKKLLEGIYYIIRDKEND